MTRGPARRGILCSVPADPQGTANLIRLIHENYPIPYLKPSVYSSARSQTIAEQRHNFVFPGKLSSSRGKETVKSRRLVPGYTAH